MMMKVMMHRHLEKAQAGRSYGAHVSQHVLVTGGAGFIGSHLVDRIIARGDRVTVLDDLSSGRREFLAHHEGALTFVEVDLCNLDAILPHFESVDLVIHLAANPDIRLGTRVTDTDLRNGTVATYNVLEAMRRHDVQRIAFASSSVVYGEGAPMPTPESHGPLLPISLYGASKLAGEALISAWVGTFGFQGWIFRFANIVGARTTHGVTYDFVHKLRTDPSRLEVLGNGRQEKSYMDVGDCADAFLHCIDTMDDRINLVNLGSVDTCSVTRIAEIVIEAMGLDASIEYTGGDRGWAGDIPRARLAIERLQASGFSVEHDSEASILGTVRWLLEEQA